MKGTVDLAIHGKRVVWPFGVIEDTEIRITKRKTRSILEHASKHGRRRDAAMILEGEVVVPGFTDLHTHGFGGLSFGGRRGEAKAAAGLLASSGVTRCYATVGQGRTFDDLRRGVRNAAESVGKDTGGARVVGVALEGPYISREKCGAWNPEHLRLPSVEELHELIAASRGRIRRLNVAPELPGALELIRAAVAAGLVVSIGHSNATAEAARSGVEAGATLSNHTYNGMSGLDHRAPGLVGETLANPALTAELILDFVHVHPVAAKALIAAKGPDKVAIISDNTALAGLPDGVYEQPGRPVTVRDGAARLAGGTLAGSVSAMDRNFRHAVELMDGDLFAAVKMCCFTPARAMGAAWGPWFGYPYSSDWLVLDEHLAVIGTVVAGEVVYQRPTAAGAA